MLGAGASVLLRRSWRWLFDISFHKHFVPKRTNRTVGGAVQQPFPQLTFLICITMRLNADVRQFRAIVQFLPEIASHPVVQIYSV